MGSDRQLGQRVNAIYFSQNKYLSKRLKLELDSRRGNRTYVVYDADLPPERRRELERRLNDSAVQGITVLATSALELGVDIEGLDACFIDEIPPSRADLLQRIGRVGRRVDRPGLVLLCLSAEPRDQHILENPCAAFRLDLSKPLAIPLHLDMLKWKHALAAFSEWESDRGLVREAAFQRALAGHFAELRSREELRKLYAERYGSLVDMDDRSWVYKGFRASESTGKIPLRVGYSEVARIDDIGIFRDAHPEAVYLGHDLNRYRVIDYQGDWTTSRREHSGSDVVLGTWLHSIKAVQVEREPRYVTTRGYWEETFKPHEIRRVTDNDGHPRKGSLKFGVWDYLRRWQGYTEIDLETDQTWWVPLDEVAERFTFAVEHGERFPFLHDFSYRTQGWQWDFGPMTLPPQEPEWQYALGDLAASLLEHFVADVVESKVADIGVRIDLPEHQFQVLDATPGGNGLSETLLTGGRMPSALENCARALSRFKGKGGAKRFSKYVLALCHVKPDHRVEVVLDVVRSLHSRWSG
jgi:hypothetical protein